MKKSLIFGVLSLLVFSLVGVAGATTTATTTPTTTPEVATTTLATTTVATSSASTTPSQLQNLLMQAREIKAKLIESILAKIKAGTATKADVKLLQKLLASEKDVYPLGAITGNYGTLTHQAVLKFRAKYGFGTSTLPQPLRLIQTGAGNSGKVPGGLLTAPGIQSKIGSTTPVEDVTKSAPKGFIKKIGNWFFGKKSSAAPATTTGTTTTN